MEKILVLSINSSEKLDLFRPKLLRPKDLDWIEIIRADNRDQFVSLLIQRKPNLVMFDPLLSHLFISDKSEINYADEADGAVGFSLLFNDIFNVIQNEINNSNFSINNMPKFIFYTVIPIDKLLKVGFPKQIENYYIQKPEYTANVINKIIEVMSEKSKTIYLE